MPTRTGRDFEPSIDELTSMPISHDYFMIDKKLTIGHIQAVFGECTVNLSQATLEKLLKKVQSDKEDAGHWGRNQVQRRMVENLQALGVNNVNTWRGLLKAWKADGSKQMANRMWNACYGLFDRDTGWQDDMENEYMTMKGYRYVSDADREKRGCFAKLFSSCKINSIKIINKVGRKSHGTEIRLKRTAEEIQKSTGGLFMKRKAGKTLGSFATVQGKNLYVPESVTEEQVVKAKTQIQNKIGDEVRVP